MDKINKDTTQLVLFALCVLDILEEHQDWDSSTTAEISNMAHHFKLARNDEHGMFEARI